MGRKLVEAHFLDCAPFPMAYIKWSVSATYGGGNQLAHHLERNIHCCTILAGCTADGDVQGDCERKTKHAGRKHAYGASSGSDIRLLHSHHGVHNPNCT